jgi:hypothetical protein
VDAGDVSIAFAICERKETSDGRVTRSPDGDSLDFSGQYSQTLTLIKLLLVTWRHGKKKPDSDLNSLCLTILSNN